MGEGGGGGGTVCPPPSPACFIPVCSLIPLLIPHPLSFCLCSSVYSYTCFLPTLPLNYFILLCFIHLLLTGGQCEHSQSSLHSCTSSLPRLIDIKLSLKQITEIFHSVELRFTGTFGSIFSFYWLFE